MLYSIVIASAIMIASVLQYYEFDWKISFVEQMLFTSEYIMANIVVLAVLIGCHYRHCFYQQFLEKLLEITASMVTCGATVDFQRIETIFNRLLLGVALLFGTEIALDFLYNDHSFWSFVKILSVYMLSNIINVLGLIQYTFLQYFIFLFYSDVNRLLTSYKVRASCDKQSSARRPMLYETTVVTPSDDGATLLYDYAYLIDLLRAIHFELNELLEQVNNCFGVLIVCTTTASFVVLSQQIFGIYQATTVPAWYTQDTFLLLYGVLWIVLHAAKVLMVLYPSHLVHKERDRTGPILYHFNPHEKDAALNNALVGALTTYLVILIQFDTGLKQGQSASNTSQKDGPGT
ncbi:AGAP006717-PA-like protein [Anopheles sinensis]|uniref:Gustatory receptor n=1 Tax=Anopheles sinensis TaxID=74873 RepID=A0A084WLL0_ANOSI|nr:AGAP006717-PA-like protein [Anopheles sinensis]